MTRPLAERFWSKVDIRPGECWIWQGQITKYGYGHFALATRKPVRAHRLAYRLINGDFDESLLVCHRCDNRACVNPTHLFLGTAADNTADICRKGRANGGGLKGEKHSQAKLTERDVRAIRAMQGTHAAIAKQFGVGMTAIAKIRTRQTWKHVA